ncbi:MmcQ/YjbR family DNA-binding protein [Mucilaginibacter myungsuensis]|uniref:MmcQ/YjbR family DNA-binding protein n=1 Tax=Mucilaginibacter myungsuensis TaxID=649104 RepID=A0A929PXT8_9SPHI|nr:MmcQ/YjbR family DNA-binding protein [Mucilaginibacter myungsuensis]MBE9663516.1 MmcQ/YjbR family DNA-binding protein [Mucilaginibacter myungsuensis]MDN3600254.1 MmcQ/YjbR family DNA-binding protein [Mucilaginibacter myungsuensis]
MVDTETFRRLALFHPDVEELPHFEKTSFRWRNKIFATLRESDGLAMVQLSLTDQDVFCSFDNGSAFYPVPNAWGKKGSTFVNFDLVREDMLADAINCAYQTLISKQLPKKSKP